MPTAHVTSTVSLSIILGQILSSSTWFPNALHPLLSLFYKDRTPDMPDFFLAMFETFLSHHLNRRRVSISFMDLPVHDREDAMPWLQNDRVGILNRLDYARDALKLWKTTMTGGVYSLLVRQLSLGCLRARARCFEP